VQDIAELEQAMRASIFPPDLLREPHALLRGFQQLLFLRDAELATAAAVGALPRTTLLLHLFSRLPAAVKMPHERTGVTPGQFSKWMDQHTPAETLQSIRHALSASAAAMKEANADVTVAVNKLLEGSS
jgi:conserved oligomeric Golgi complex subunit 5